MWQRHYLKELFLAFSFVLLLSYILYAMIDYASHASLFHSLSLGKLLLYYFFQFSLHAEILLPLSFLLALLKVLLTSQRQREPTILMSAGISKKKYTLPFLLFTLFVILLSYLNFEWIQPKVAQHLIPFEKKISRGPNAVHSLTLEDQSILLYQSYDPLANQLFDLCWMKNKEECYRMEWLFLDHPVPLGQEVDHFKRDHENSHLTRIAHYESFSFPSLVLPKDLSHKLTPPRSQSISRLAKQIAFPLRSLDKHQTALLTHFIYKLLMPWSSLVLTLAILCKIMPYRRLPFPLMIYGLSLFGYITLFTLLGASVILAENQILHPVLALGLPMGILGCYLGYRYAKL